MMWELVLYNDGYKRMPQLIQYIDERYRLERRWISTADSTSCYRVWLIHVGALKRLDLPVHILWGRSDSVAPPQIAEKLLTEIPNVKISWMKCGHFCMLEDPEGWVKNALPFYSK